MLTVLKSSVEYFLLLMKYTLRGKTFRTFWRLFGDSADGSGLSQAADRFSETFLQEVTNTCWHVC